MARKKRQRWEVFQVKVGNRMRYMVSEDDAREWAVHCLLVGITIGGALWITIPLLSLLFV